MKHSPLLIAFLFINICFAGNGFAQSAFDPKSISTVPFASAPPADAAAMVSCTTQYRQQNIPKSQYHSFMNECVKNAKAATPAPSPTTGQ